MIAYNEMQDKYWQQWPVKRVNKWWYIIKHGVLYWALPVLLITVLLEKRTYRGALELDDIFIRIGVWGVFGLIYGYWAYASKEKGYKKYLSVKEQGDSIK